MAGIGSQTPSYNPAAIHNPIKWNIDRYLNRRFKIRPVKSPVLQRILFKAWIFENVPLNAPA